MRRVTGMSPENTNEIPIMSQIEVEKESNHKNISSQ
jgi:hypothetical protein